MKKKFELRKVLLELLPWLHVTLIIAPIFSYAASYVWQMEVITSYLWGATVIIPVAVTRLLITRINNFFVYIILSLLMAAAWYFVNPILGVVVLFIAVIRLAGRLRSGNTTIFDSPHYAGLAAFVLPFVFSAADELPALQIISLVSALVYGILTLLFRSLKRLDNYIDMNLSMADFPVRRVNSTTLKTVSAVAGILLVLCLVILVVNFDFVTLPELTNPGDAIEDQYADAQFDAAEMMPMKNTGFPSFGRLFNINWNVVGRVLVSFAAVIIIIVLSVVIYRVAGSFAESSTLREEKDTIEKIRDVEEKLSTEKEKPKLILDFSPNAVVRRKYRKLILSKNKSPMPWHSPAELEAAANVDDPSLHELYEKARYSKSGCTQEDKKRI